MAGVRLEFRFEHKQFSDAINGMMLTGARKTGLLRAIGVGLQHTTKQRFETGMDPSGHRWAPLRPWYAALKRGPGILREAGMRGGLQGSITFATGANSVTVGSNKIYAAVHQFGATIKPLGSNKHGLLVLQYHGMVVGFAKQVTIPARPYLGFGPEDELVVLDALDVLLPGGGAA